MASHIRKVRRSPTLLSFQQQARTFLFAQTFKHLISWLSFVILHRILFSGDGCCNACPFLLFCFQLVGFMPVWEPGLKGSSPITQTDKQIKTRLGPLSPSGQTRSQEALTKNVRGRLVFLDRHMSSTWRDVKHLKVPFLACAEDTGRKQKRKREKKNHSPC